MSALTNDAHERFASEYLKDLNATEAYQRVYPKATAKSARTAGPRLLANVGIAQRVAELQQERAQRVQVETDDVLRELLVLATSDVRNFIVSDSGELELKADAPDNAWRAVSSVKHRIISHGEEMTVREIEYRLWDKPGTLKTLMQHLGLLVERHEHTGKGGKPIDQRVVFVIEDNGRAG